jgi:hypothetical protein
VVPGDSTARTWFGGVSAVERLLWQHSRLRAASIAVEVRSCLTVWLLVIMSYCHPQKSTLRKILCSTEVGLSNGSSNGEWAIAVMDASESEPVNKDQIRVCVKRQVRQLKT